MWVSDVIESHINKLSGRNKEIAEKRIKVCQTCIFFIAATLVCKRCGCPMEAKGTLEKAKCPLNKW